MADRKRDGVRRSESQTILPQRGLCRCGDAGVAKAIADHAQIDAFEAWFAGVGVPQAVGMYPLLAAAVPAGRTKNGQVLQPGR